MRFLRPGVAIMLAALLGGCGGGGAAAPPPAPVTSVNVVATYEGLPLTAMVIVESTNYDASTHTATGVLASIFTNGNGVATFSGLTPGAQYCFSFHTGYRGTPIYGFACQRPVLSSTIYLNTPQ